MVRLGQPRAHDFISNFTRKGDVDQPFTMDVADFTPAQPVLGPAEAVGVGGSALPAQHGGLNFVARVHGYFSQ